MKQLALTLLLSAVSAVPVAAQDMPHIHKQNLQAVDYPAGHRTLMIRTTIDPRATMPPHTHPGIEAGYVLQGSALLRVAGRPDLKASAGTSFIVPARAVHSLVNTGPTPLIVLTNYVVETGKPVVDPVKK